MERSILPKGCSSIAIPTVMSVPAHDARDYAFAKVYDLPIKQVIYPADGSDITVDEEAYVEKGILKNSAEFDGLDSEKLCLSFCESF